MKKYLNNNRGGSIIIVIVLLLLLAVMVTGLFASMTARSKNNQEERSSLQIYYTARSITVAMTEKIKNRDLDTVKNWEDTVIQVFQQASEKYSKPSWMDAKYQTLSAFQTVSDLEDSYIQDVETWRDNFISYVKYKVRSTNEAEFHYEAADGIQTVGTIVMNYREGESVQPISSFEEAKVLAITPEMIFSGMEIQIQTTASSADGNSSTISAIMKGKSDSIVSIGGVADGYQFLAENDIIIDGQEGTGSTVEGNIISKNGDISLDRVETKGMVLSEAGNIKYEYTDVWTGNNLDLDTRLRAKNNVNIFLTNGQILTANFDIHAGKNIDISGTGGNEFGGTYKSGKNFSFVAPKTFYGTVDANGSATLAELDFYGTLRCSGNLVIGNRDSSTKIDGSITYGGSITETDVMYLGDMPSYVENFHASVADMTETSLTLEEAKPSWVEYMLNNNSEDLTLEEFNQLCQSGPIDTTNGDRFFTVIYSNRDKIMKHDLKVKGNNRVFVNFQPGKNASNVFVTIDSKISLGGKVNEDIESSSCQLFFYSDGLPELQVKDKVDINAQFYIPNADFVAEGTGNRNQFNGKLCARSIELAGYQFQMSTLSAGNSVWEIQFQEGGLDQ